MLDKRKIVNLLNKNQERLLKKVVHSKETFRDPTQYSE
jgi:hypothetical protein